MMKRVVLLNDLDIPDIVSKSLYKEYIIQLEEDIKMYFSNKSLLVNVPCPGCGKKENDDG